MSDEPSMQPRAAGTTLEVPRTLKDLFAARLDWTARYGLFVVALTTVTTIVGVALSPYLLTRHPVLLVLLSPIPRHMILVAPSLDLTTFVTVGATRQMFATSGALCVGLRFGDAGIAWAEQQGDRLRRAVAFLRVGFRRGGLLVVFLAPYPFVAATAVAIGAPVSRVVVAVASGHVVWLVIWHRFGDWASGWIAPITEFFRLYTWESTAACVVGVALYYLNRLRRRPIAASPRSADQ